jgi:hypothetical protein
MLMAAKSLAVVARKVSEVFTIASQGLMGGDTNVWAFFFLLPLVATPD